MEGLPKLLERLGEERLEQLEEWRQLLVKQPISLLSLPKEKALMKGQEVEKLLRKLWQNPHPLLRLLEDFLLLNGGQ